MFSPCVAMFRVALLLPFTILQVAVIGVVTVPPEDAPEPELALEDVPEPELGGFGISPGVAGVITLAWLVIMT
jgi:hypothetical protein